MVASTYRLIDNYGQNTKDTDMNHIKNAWKEYASDFNAMTDEQIKRETEHSQNMIDEHEAWLEAVASWEQAGRPRNTDDTISTKEWLASIV